MTETPEYGSLGWPPEGGRWQLAGRRALFGRDFPLKWTVSIFPRRFSFLKNVDAVLWCFF